MIITFIKELFSMFRKRLCYFYKMTTVKLINVRINQNFHPGSTIFEVFCWLLCEFTSQLLSSAILPSSFSSIFRFVGQQTRKCLQ